MFHSRFKSLALILPVLILPVACDQKPSGPGTTVAQPAAPSPAATTPGRFPAPEIKADMPVYSAQSEDHWAQVVGEPGWAYEWTLDGGLFTSGITADTIRFKTGNPGRLLIRCKITDGSGREATASLAPRVVPLPTVDVFETSRAVLTRGEGITLRWEATDHETLNLLPGTQDINQLSVIRLQPTETTTFVLTATNLAGSKVEKALEVKVVPPPTIQRFAAEGTSKIGQPLNLIAEFADGKAEIRLGTNVLASSSESPLRLQVTPATGTAYTLIVTNDAGATVSVQVSVAVAPPRK